MLWKWEKRSGGGTHPSRSAKVASKQQILPGLLAASAKITSVAVFTLLSDVAEARSRVTLDHPTQTSMEDGRCVCCGVGWGGGLL